MSGRGEGRPARVRQLSLPASFERLVAAVGGPAHARLVPPPAAPDVDKLQAAAKFGQEILGPPGQWPVSAPPGR